MRASPAERVGAQPLAPSSLKLWAFGVAALTFFAFLPTLSNGWVDMDDMVLVLRNAHLYALSAKNLAWMFGGAHGGHYHPLTWLSLSLNMSVFGAGPTSFHAVDLLLHCASAVLLFFIARRLLQSSPVAAAAAALFFAIHPLRVESVAWAIERRDTLSGFFYLAAIISHLKAIDEPGKHWRRLSWLAYALSLLSKGVGLTLPLALILLDVYALRRDWKAALDEKIPYGLMAGATAAAAILAESQNGSTLPLSQYSAAQRLAVAAYGLAFYLRATIMPWNLRPLYELPAALEPASLRFLASGIFVAAVAISLFLTRRRWPALAAAGFFYFITVFPMLGLLRFGPQLAADRYSYLPCLGFALLFGAVLEQALASAAENRQNALMLAALILGALGVQTFRQTARWRDAETLWRYALDVDPDVALAQQHLGYALAGRHQYAQAVSHYQKAIALKSDYWLAWNNLGWSLAAQGRLEEACAAYRKALDLKPDYWEARSNLGLALGRMNKLWDAEQEFLAAVKLAPDEPGVHNNLGLVYYTQGRLDESAAEFTTALKLEPGQREATMMLRRLGRLP